MKCPIDDTELKMTDRQGVEIDYCPKCRGVWLDRGELDKIIDRMSGVETRNAVPTMPQQRFEQSNYSKHGKRKGLLGELFDF